MKRNLFLLLSLLSQVGYAGTGNFFQIAESGVAARIEIILCLNGKRPITCENHTVNHVVLDISTVTPHHTYFDAGIFLKTPGYSLDTNQCKPISNGFCLFSVNDTTKTTISIGPIVSPPSSETAPIIVVGSPLGLNVGGTTGTLTIFNQSKTIIAKNITSNFSGTALAGEIQETGNTCQILMPQQTCELTFLPGINAVSETPFLIEGSNTTWVSAAISVNPPRLAVISISNSPLALVTGGKSGSITVTNNSRYVTALNITSDFTGTALDGKVTETGNTCSSLAPLQNCTLIFTSGGTAVPETAFPIKGTNTFPADTTGSISIRDPSSVQIQVENSPLILNVNSQEGTLTIRNLSPNVTATNITANFTGTNLDDGKVTEQNNHCGSLLPGASCTIGFLPGATPVDLTSFPIQGSNTNTVSAAIEIKGITIGELFGGGKIGCLTANGGVQNLIVTIQGSSLDRIWSPAPLSSIGATSTTNGLNNTNLIVAAIGSSTNFPAGACATFERDSEGNVPCQPGNTCYNDWYLPATEEYTCLFQNRAEIGGFSNTTYWTSTEKNKNSANAISFENGTISIHSKDAAQFATRCVRRFTP